MSERQPELIDRQRYRTHLRHAVESLDCAVSHAYGSDVTDGRGTLEIRTLRNNVLAELERAEASIKTHRATEREARKATA
jgi:hypothetical protein